ncbi:MAG: biotin carboxylase N-terminal domain-containing protein [Hyphomonadaceae bacterium]
MLKSVLIANRGEIARRVIRTALTLPSMGRVAAERRGGVRALASKKEHSEARSETFAGLTLSVTLRVTAPPSRGSGSASC